jgi:hypothetical protein
VTISQVAGFRIFAGKHHHFILLVFGQLVRDPFFETLIQRVSIEVLQTPVFSWSPPMSAMFLA